MNFRPPTRACRFTRRTHFQALTSRIFFNLPLRSNANKKVIDTQFTFVLYFLVFVKRISRRSPRSGNVQTCQRSDVLTSFTPNSHRIISFTDPHPLTLLESYRFKNSAGMGVPQFKFFPYVLTTLLPYLLLLSPLAATLMDLPASVANKRLTVWLNPLDATLTKNRGWGEGRVHHQRKALLLWERAFCSELETAN